LVALSDAERIGAEPETISALVAEFQHRMRSLKAQLGEGGADGED
jgi:hypothetical protein